MTDLRYPLAWPDGWPRTAPLLKKSSRYKVSQDRAQNELLRSIKLMGGRSVVISTNLQLRKTDGLPKASQRKPDDTGVAVYFVRKGKDFCIACDRYEDLRSNMRAIGLALDGLRAVERAGVTELLDRAFQGFSRLPASIIPAPPNWRVTLGLVDGWPRGIKARFIAESELLKTYRRAISRAHPDKGGSHEKSVRVHDAYERAKQEVKDHFPC